MTLVIGAYSFDGLVLGADRKFVGPGTSFNYGSKILRIPPKGNYFSTAGVIGLADTFLEAYNERAMKKRPFGIIEVKSLVEDVLRELNKRYKDSLPPWLRNVVGVLIGPGKKGPEGYHIVGGMPRTRLRSESPIFVGAGRNYAESFFPLLFDPSLEAPKIAEAIVWIISWVSSVCDPVGFENESGPDVLILSQENHEIKSQTLSKEKTMEICQKTRIDANKVRDIFLPNITKKEDFEKLSPQFFGK